MFRVVEYGVSIMADQSAEVVTICLAGKAVGVCREE